MRHATNIPEERRRASEFLPLRPVEFQILLVLADRPRHGYAIMQVTEEHTGGEMVLEPGTLYRALQRLKGWKLIGESERRPVPELDDQRRRYYTLTALGREVAAAEATRMARLVDAARVSRLIPQRRAR